MSSLLAALWKSTVAFAGSSRRNRRSAIGSELPSTKYFCFTVLPGGITANWNAFSDGFDVIADLAFLRPDDQTDPLKIQ
jgi:hypothetical protein